MPDTIAEPVAAVSAVSQLSRIGERVAALEARQAEQHSALKSDTDRIRTSVHDINNEMQKFVYVEQQCANSLKTLSDQHAALTVSIATLTVSMGTLTSAKDRAEGRSEGGLWVLGKAVLVAVAIIGALAWTADYALKVAEHVVKLPSAGPTGGVK